MAQTMPAASFGPVIVAAAFSELLRSHLTPVDTVDNV